MLAQLTSAIVGPPNGSPLGRFSDIVTAIVSVGLIAAAVAAHLVALSDPFLDSAALLALGILFGTARGQQAGQAAAADQLATRANLNTELALAAHRRLDTISAPPAPLDHTGLAVGAGQTDGQLESIDRIANRG